MELTITKETANTFLERKEVEGSITFQGATPSKNTLTEELAKKYAAEKNTVVIKEIKNKYGHQHASITAAIYKDEQARKRSEPLTHVERKKVEEEKKKAAEQKGA